MLENQPDSLETRIRGAGEADAVARIQRSAPEFHGLGRKNQTHAEAGEQPPHLAFVEAVVLFTTDGFSRVGKERPHEGVGIRRITHCEDQKRIRFVQILS
jgi:hypothetical protein